MLLLVCVAAATTPDGKRKVSRFKSLRLNPGTAIEIRLLSQIHSREAQEGDTFEPTLAKPLVVDGRTVLPKNTGATGRVVEAVSSGRLKRPASLTLELVDAGSYNLRTEPVALGGESHAGRNAALIGGGAAAGAIIGALTGGKKGAVIGAAIGAGAGTGTAYLTGKKELVLPVEFLIGFATAGSASPARQRSAGSRRCTWIIPNRGNRARNERKARSRRARCGEPRLKPPFPRSLALIGGPSITICPPTAPTCLRDWPSAKGYHADWNVSSAATGSCRRACRSVCSRSRPGLRRNCHPCQPASLASFWATARCC